MTTLRLWFLGVAVVAVGWSANLRKIDNDPPDPGRIPQDW